MLDTQMKAQLQAYLQNLRQPIRLVASLDGSDKSAEMRELLTDIAELSDKVSFELDCPMCRVYRLGPV
jgi:alkyl hydroperoxide reductase subunit F